MSQDHGTTQMSTDVTESPSDTPQRNVDSPDEHTAADARHEDVEHPATEEDHENPLVTEGDIAADYLEDLLDIADLDGDIDTYVENEDLDTSLPLHALRPGEQYRLGFFMVGAYQEILGDIHNLFGDTDAVEVKIQGDGIAVAQQRRGDTTDVMLDYVGYRLDDLRARYTALVDAASLGTDESQRLKAALEAGLTGYTYLDDTPLE